MSHFFQACGLALAMSFSVSAQQSKQQTDKPAAKIPRPIPIDRPKQPNAPAQIPDALTNRLMNMTPEERELALANLAPQRREAIQQRLERLDQLPDDQKARLNRRFEEFQKLSPVRRQAIREEMQTLRALRPPERRTRINSPEFREQYSAEEVRLMRDVWNIR